jgi:D-beta-D-heptose 7-phosphate kinase/D-beta-D-heptose 1-phosphate adenosyltransferase
MMGQDPGLDRLAAWSSGPDSVTRVLIERFSQLSVLVVGDAVLDVWMYGDANRLSREGPVPVVDITTVDLAPGGAANCAANAAALGADVEYLGVVGDDEAGDGLVRMLRHKGIGTRGLIADDHGKTATKRRVVCGEHEVARFDTPASGWSESALTSLWVQFAALAADADVVVVADYGGGALADHFPEALAALRGSVRGPLVIDGHHFERWRMTRPTAMTPSLDEATVLMGLPAERERALAALHDHAEELVREVGCDMVVATLDAAGSVLLQADRRPYRTRPADSSARHTCGAGDTFTTVFAMALAAGADPAAATDLAQRSADAVVREPGTTCCTPAKLLAQCMPSGGVVRDHAVLADVVAEHRRAGRRIIFTNGCFDLLHLGHAEYLRQARRLGDLLVVGVNSDHSVARLKGPGRPVLPEDERAALLAALEPVDLVTVFDEPTPRVLLELLRPDLYVKGGDYTADMLSEADIVNAIGGEVVTVGYVQGRSTTELVDRIQAGAQAQRRADAGL